MSASEFFHMGGYALYVWSSYGIALVLLGWTFISPVFTKKSIIKDLKIKYRQQERQAGDNQARDNQAGKNQTGENQTG